MLVRAILTLGRLAEFALSGSVAAVAALRGRPSEVVRQFERVAWGSLPIVAVAGLSVGAVSWMQSRRQLVAFGLDETLPSVLGAAVIVETGPMLASILVAARIGAGLAAEFSSKRLTEELDATEVLGAPVMEALVGPRIAACVLALPLLTIVIDTAALLGGLAAELAGGSLSAVGYARRCMDYVRLVDAVPGTLKTAVFGGVIGLLGCWVGLRSDRSTEAIGRSATAGVVLSILAVFGLNLLIVPLVQASAAALGWRF